MIFLHGENTQARKTRKTSDSLVLGADEQGVRGSDMHVEGDI